MARRRWHRFLFAAASLLSCAGLAVAEGAGLSGRILDPHGDRLPEVRVFLIASGARGTPAAEALTRADGSFTLGYPGPGTYLLAAVKSGYQTTFQRVDSWLRDRLVLVLHPLQDVPDSERPQDEAWVLRLPGESILRDADGLRASVEPGRGGARAGLDHWLDGAVHQSFTVAGRSGAAGERSLALGSETRLTLASVLTEQARLRFEGRHTRIEPERAPSGPGIEQRRDAAMHLGLDLATGLDSDLVVSAFIDQAAADPGASQRSWRYDAAWSKQIDPRSHVRVRVDYSGLESGSGPALPRDSNRTIGAESSYESIAARGHQVRVGFRAERVERPTAWIAIGPGAAPASDDGWNVRVAAEDAWSLTPSLILTYGVDYRQQLDAESRAVVTPRTGTVLMWRGARLEAGFSYHLESGPPSDRGSVDRRPWGYDAAVELPLPARIRVQARAEYAPHRLDEDRGLDADPIYLGRTDTTVARRALRVERDFVGGSGFVEWTDGRAEGWVAPVLALGGPVYRLQPGSLEFASGRVGGHVGRTGTGVRLDFRRLTEEERQPGGEAPIRHEWGLVLTQDLPLPARPVAWQVMVAALASRSDEPERADSDHRMSAGFAVRF